MTNTATDGLDAEELLHLALLASQQDKHEESISYLKRAQTRAPKEGKVYYLLGAEHAQIGLYDRAVEEMSRAIELDPGLHTARFQLGLLHITAGRVDQATKTWEALDALGTDHPLYQFKAGMLCLAQNEFEQCAGHLRKGIRLNRQNEVLNHDMSRILADVEKQLVGVKAADPTPDNKPVGGNTNHVLLSAYRQNRNGNDDTD